MDESTATEKITTDTKTSVPQMYMLTQPIL